MGIEKLAEKGIIFYDFMAVNGGAEKLTQTLLKAFPDVDLCAGYVNEKAFPDLWAGGGKVHDLNADSNVPLWRILKLIWAFEHDKLDLNSFDWALFSGIYAPFAVKRRSRNRNILYCHTIPRFCFDLRQHYMQKLPWILRPILAALIMYVTQKYSSSLARMDVVIANSENVRLRLKRNFLQESIVINPPVETRRFQWISEGDYYISLARLENFKRVDQVVRAFIAMPDRKLVVASGGTELAKLRRLADGCTNISFTGWLAEDSLRKLVGQAKAAIYVPMDEDFGMSPVEAMAAGKPVIGVAEGGLLETIVDGETGILIPSAIGALEISSAVRKLETMRPELMRKACVERANMFSKEKFLIRMAEVLSK